MATLTQSHFLQALGWATLNSVWQMAALWILFCLVRPRRMVSANRSFRLAVVAMLCGFLWFLATFIGYIRNGASSSPLPDGLLRPTNEWLQVCLTAASVTYLLLFVFPAARFWRNWQTVKRLKTDGRTKAQVEHRLFVQKYAFLLGIKRKVAVYLSGRVTSPVTLGYLKPVILLPVAALNQLTTAQVEAVLLHELSHIRRCDYLLNFGLLVVHTVLYFNPFANFFMQVVEEEREACCDSLVLQFGYNRLSYASALLHLQQVTTGSQALALAAAGQKSLLTRIEKIVGMEKKKTFGLSQVVPFVLAIGCVVLFNSVLFLRDAGNDKATFYSDNAVLTPFQLEGSAVRELSPEWATQNDELAANRPPKESRNFPARMSKPSAALLPPPPAPAPPPPPPPPLTEHLLPANFDDVNGRLTATEKANVKKSLEVTKKLAATVQWNAIENSIGDAMSENEKRQARIEYLEEVEKVNWNNVEENLRANYEKLDWEAVERNVDKALMGVSRDSLMNVYRQALTAIAETEAAMYRNKKCPINPMPDVSLAELKKAKETLHRNLDSLKATLKVKKVVCL